MNGLDAYYLVSPPVKSGGAGSPAESGDGARAPTSEATVPAAIVKGGGEGLTDPLAEIGDGGPQAFNVENGGGGHQLAPSEVAFLDELERVSKGRRFVGGKGSEGVVQAIVNQIPPHDTYVEPFLGKGTVLRAKLPASRNIGVEKDFAIYSAWFRWAPVPGLNVLNGDAVRFLSYFKPTNETVVYCDPPYLLETRRGKRLYYSREFATKKEHERLLECLLRLRVKVLISGYWSSLYSTWLQGWRTVSYQSVDRRGRTRQEWLWLNYPEPFELHDYRFLGRNYRERERIKRKKARWRSKLQRMPFLERAAILDAISEIRGRSKADAS